jgi:hypothetical protein
MTTRTERRLQHKTTETWTENKKDQEKDRRGRTRVTKSEPPLSLPLAPSGLQTEYLKVLQDNT